MLAETLTFMKNGPVVMKNGEEELTGEDQPVCTSSVGDQGMRSRELPVSPK